MTPEYIPTGLSHVFNAQTKNVLGGLYHFYPHHCTVQQISELIEQPYQLVADVFKRWFKFGYRYASRRRVKGVKHGIKYEYLIKPEGVRALIEFTHRQNLGFDLSRRRSYPIKIDKYLVKTKPKGKKRGNMCNSTGELSDLK